MAAVCASTYHTQSSSSNDQDTYKTCRQSLIQRLNVSQDLLTLSTDDTSEHPLTQAKQAARQPANKAACSTRSPLLLFGVRC